jgi:hypothetical protein
LEIESCYIAQAVPKLLILQPLAPKCWDYRCVLTHLALLFCRFISGGSCGLDCESSPKANMLKDFVLSLWNFGRPGRGEAGPWDPGPFLPLSLLLGALLCRAFLP